MLFTPGCITSIQLTVATYECHADILYVKLSFQISSNHGPDAVPEHYDNKPGK